MFSLFIIFAANASVYGRCYPKSGLKLPHKMYVAFITAHFGYLLYGNIGRGQNKFGVFYPAVYYLVHRTYPEYFFVGMLKVGFAHDKLLSQAFYTPIVLRHTVNF